MEQSQRSRDLEKGIWGAVLILTGIFFFLSQRDLVDLGEFWRFIGGGVMVVIGITKLLTARDNDERYSGIWLVGTGSWLIVSMAGLFGLDFGTSWPLLVVFSGIIMVARAVSVDMRKEESRGNDAAAAH